VWTTDETGKKLTTNPVCEPDSPSIPSLTQVTGSLVEITSWATLPEVGLQLLAEQLAPEFMALLAASNSLEVHSHARSAKVPIMMYHDILPEKLVFFDVTIAELEADFQFIKNNGITPITPEQLLLHLRTGVPLPSKPVLLTFDDGYAGHYQHVYPLLKKYNYPAVFGIFTGKVDGKIAGRSTVTWAQLREMVANPLVTIAAHSVTHPPDLTTLPDDKLTYELVESKRRLEEQLGIPITYFVYPEGKYDQRVADATKAAGYQAAFTMSDTNEIFAGQSESLLAIGRFGQSRLEEILPQAFGGNPLPKRTAGGTFDFSAPIERSQTTINQIPLELIHGGRPITIHAKSRYQVQEIVQGTPATAVVDGGFFSLEYLDSNKMIGPVMGQNTGRFIPGEKWDREKIRGRPLVLINPQQVKFMPFDPNRHNTLAGVQAELPGVTDVFVAAARLVKEGVPQPAETFGDLFDFNEPRHRAFWGINQAGQPKIGVTVEPVGSVELGEILAKAGFRDAVMLDSGASTSLAYQGESLVGYTPRPVPHVVALLPPGTTMPKPGCTTTIATQPSQSAMPAY
jgi:peptidoglycan/xylan/chitin deacetylase (PgdA/CDA1 family)